MHLVPIYHSRIYRYVLSPTIAVYAPVSHEIGTVSTLCHVGIRWSRHDHISYNGAQVLVMALYHVGICGSGHDLVSYKDTRAVRLPYYRVLVHRSETQLCIAESYPHTHFLRIVFMSIF